jgi:PiT family inorganic phosphate transporter
MEIFDLSTGSLFLLGLAVSLALLFEFVNGFHDTANAVATVIYTKSLRPTAAVILSGICNFLGVLFSGIAVAMGIIKLLPLEILVSKSSNLALAMIFALLITALLWNLGTWYLGIPASSSHTLIGSIVGVGLGNSLRPEHTFGEGVNWQKAAEVGLSLLISPLCGFILAALLLLLMRVVIKNRTFYEEPRDGEKTPFGVRATLIFTCMGVSFAHGSNDGQKGIGLIMLLLIGILPGTYALNLDLPTSQIQEARSAVNERSGKELIPEVSSLREIPPKERFLIRSESLTLNSNLKNSDSNDLLLKEDRKKIASLYEFVPTWVTIAVALTLGIGTMVGWQRIVITVGEKIGKSHLTYAKGAAAEIVAMVMILASSALGLPVSTTHVLSSGIAGTMVVGGDGIQTGTVKKILLAWVLTLPVCIIGGAGLFLFFATAFS